MQMSRDITKKKAKQKIYNRKRREVHILIPQRQMNKNWKSCGRKFKNLSLGVRKRYRKSSFKPHMKHVQIPLIISPIIAA